MRKFSLRPACLWLCLAAFLHGCVSIPKYQSTAADKACTQGWSDAGWRSSRQTFHAGMSALWRTATFRDPHPLPPGPLPSSEVLARLSPEEREAYLNCYALYMDKGRPSSLVFARAEGYLIRVAIVAGAILGIIVGASLAGTYGR